MSSDALDSMADSERHARGALSEEEQEQLSKALFPDTHTDEVEVLGVERTLRPLPVKYARKVHSLLHPISTAVEEAGTEKKSKKKGTDLDTQLLDGCLKAAKVLCDFYGEEWADLKEALATEEIQFDEVQALLVQQAALQKANDFLLTPLRIVVGTMRFAEVAAIQYMSTFNGLHSLNNITALLSSSSQPTPSLS